MTKKNKKPLWDEEKDILYIFCGRNRIIDQINFLIKKKLKSNYDN